MARVARVGMIPGVRRRCMAPTATLSALAQQGGEGAVWHGRGSGCGGGPVSCEMACCKPSPLPAAARSCKPLPGGAGRRASDRRRPSTRRGGRGRRGVGPRSTHQRLCLVFFPEPAHGACCDGCGCWIAASHLKSNLDLNLEISEQGRWLSRCSNADGRTLVTPLIGASNAGSNAGTPGCELVDSSSGQHNAPISDQAAVETVSCTFTTTRALRLGASATGPATGPALDRSSAQWVGS